MLPAKNAVLSLWSRVVRQGMRLSHDTDVRVVIRRIDSIECPAICPGGVLVIMPLDAGVIEYSRYLWSEIWCTNPTAESSNQVLLKFSGRPSKRKQASFQATFRAQETPRLQALFLPC